MFLRPGSLSVGRIALAVGAAAALARILAVLVVFEDRFYFSDERNYVSRAETMAAGRWLGVDTIAPPGPVYFLALARAAGLDLDGIRILQALLGGVTAGLAVLVAAALFGRSVAFWTGLGVAFYPYLVYIAGILYTQNQVMPLLLLVILALLRRQAGGGAGWLAAAGLGWGVAGMFMVPSLLTAPLLGLWHAFRVRPMRRGVLDVAVMAAIAVLSLVPVTIRNYALDGRFVFISSMGGRAFYWANQPDVDPADRDRGRWIELNIRRVEEERIARGWTQAQTDSALSARGRAWVREHPGRFLRNYMARVETLWSFTPRPFTENEHTGRLPLLVAGVSSAPVVVLSLLAFLFFIRRIGALFPLYAVPAALTAVFSLFHTTVRYRLTVEPILIALAVALLVRIFRPALLGGLAFAGREGPARGTPPAGAGSIA